LEQKQRSPNIPGRHLSTHPRTEEHCYCATADLAHLLRGEVCALQMSLTFNNNNNNEIITYLLIGQCDKFTL